MNEKKESKIKYIKTVLNDYIEFYRMENDLILKTWSVEKLEECVSYLIVSRKSTKENIWCKEHDLIKKIVKIYSPFSQLYESN